MNHTLSKLEAINSQADSLRDRVSKFMDKRRQSAANRNSTGIWDAASSTRVPVSVPASPPTPVPAPAPPPAPAPAPIFTPTPTSRTPPPPAPTSRVDRIPASQRRPHTAGTFRGSRAADHGEKGFTRRSEWVDHRGGNRANARRRPGTAAATRDRDRDPQRTLQRSASSSGPHRRDVTVDPEIRDSNPVNREHLRTCEFIAHLAP